MRTFLKFFCIQFLSYAIFCWNARAIAQARLGNIAVSDLTYAWVQFHLIQEVSKAKGQSAKVGYIFGGVTGSLASVIATKYLWGA